MSDYRRIADRIADDIATGRLRPGQRLPPQRAFARRRGIASSTAGRVYGELVRRGLVVGEVGRGTFVRAAPDGPAGQALIEPGPAAAPVNLELNYPATPGQPELLAPVLAPLLRPDVLAEALLPAAATGTEAAREAAATLLTTPGWRPAPERLLFTGNARQAIAAVLASLVRPGGRVGVEQLTYPLVKEIAARLGITLVPLAGDASGLLPEAVAAAHRSAPLSALYVQPTLHNPTSLTTSRPRLLQLAQLVHDLNLPVVEDRIWSFLREPGDPLAVHARAHRRVSRGAAAPGRRRGPGRAVGRLERGAVRAGGGRAVGRGGDGGAAGGGQAGGRGTAAADPRRGTGGLRRTVRPGCLLRLVGAARAVARGHLHGRRRGARHRRHTRPRLRRRPRAHARRRQARARDGSGTGSATGTADPRACRRATSRGPYRPVTQAPAATVRPSRHSSQDTVRRVAVRAS